MKHQDNLYTAAQTRELDRLAIQYLNISGYELMQRAGQAVFEQIQQRWSAAEHLAIFCGAGNNAGDGYVVATLAKQAGLSPCVYTLADPEGLTGEAQQAWQACVKENVTVEPFVSGMHCDTEVVVDALMGTGLQRALAANWLTAVDCMNVSPGPVIAVDVPSGVNADNGQVMGAAVRADVTVAFIGLNRGLFTGEAPEYTGEIVFDDLQVEENCYRAVASEVALLSNNVLKYLPPRARTSHKHQCGHVLVIGGNTGMAGAPILAARAALRTGAGMVSVATRPQHVNAVVSAQPELMVQGIDDAMAIKSLLAKASAVAIGPGLGQDDWALSLLDKVVESRLPAVIDADALNLLAKEPARCENWILTPHVGEAARLLSCDTNEIMQDRFAAVEQLQQHYAGIAILKGPGTLIAHSRIAVCKAGNPGMATAGMGDVLAGVIAALLAQGLSSVHAAELGVWLHATAGDLEAQQHGERGLVATDLLPRIRHILHD